MKQFLLLLSILCYLTSFAQIEDELESPLKHLQKAEKLYHKNNCQEGLEHINKTIAAQMNNWEAYQLRARIYECLRKYDKAISDYSILILWQPENGEFLFSRGELRYKVKQYQLALEDLKKALHLPDQETNQVFFSSASGEEGVSGISTFATLKAEMENYIGLCYHELQQYDSAVLHFTNAINDRKDLRYFNNRAITFEALELWDNAVKDYENALQLDSKDEITKYNLIMLYGKTGKLSLQKDLLESLSASKKFPEIYILKGVNNFQLGNYRLAVSYYDSAIQLDNKMDEYFIYRGQAKEKYGNSRAAIDDYKRALAINDTNPSTYFGLGNTYYGIHELDSAKICYDLTIFYDSHFYKAYLNRAVIFLNKNEHENACRDLKIAIKGDIIEARNLFEKKCNKLE